MHHFQARNGTLHAEDVPLDRLANEVGTPFYCYSSATLERHFRVFREAFAVQDALVCFAVKANSNLSVLRTLAREGAGADVVSQGELCRALAAGVPPERIVFSGVGKTAAEMSAALDAEIYQFNVESEPELDLLDRVARDKGRKAPVAFRINPDVDAGTHDKIATGKADNKFGIPRARARAAYARARELAGVEVVGVDMHIGSQITALGPFELAFQSLRELIEELRADGHTIARADLGGGLGIPYDPDQTAPPLPVDYARMIERIVHKLDLRLIFEPGRMIVGNAGILVARVLYVKQGQRRPFIVLDAAMNDLLRPALYDAWHEIVPVRASTAEPIEADIVGPVCETGDTFATARPIAPVGQGDLVVIFSAGAYGAAQASAYNSRLLVPEVLVKGGEFAVVRPRPSYEEMLAQERIAAWLT